MQQYDEIRGRRGVYAVNLLLLMLMSSASTLSIITLNTAALVLTINTI